MPLSPGTKIGNYEIQAPLGEGGMGAVYQAHDPTLQRTVAIKVLAKQDEDASARLLQEARAASALNHPHICTIHEVGEHEGQAFIVMEHVEGKPLSALIPADGLPPESVIRYGTQIADALAHAHERGIVHRDLKSANVVITPEGRAKVLDFGLAARMPQADAEAVTKTQEAIPHAGMLVGTLAYMAPEVLRGEAATARSDIWALGVLLYEMASGRLPFGGDTAADVASNILKESPAALPSRVSASLRAIVQRCLAKEARQRYLGAMAVQAALETVQSDTGTAPSVTARAGARRWGIAALGAGVTLLAVVGGLVFSGTEDTGLSGAISSLAVLPLVNLSGDPEQEYFADGMTEALITDLAQISALKVISRTTAMRYKGTDKPLPDIARELGVDAVVEGSVMRADDQVRITAQLIRAATDEHIWADSYQREFHDVLALQAEVAQAIAREIEVTLTTQEETLLAQTGSVVPEAHDAYLRGRYHLNQRTDEQIALGMEYFQRAIDLDPDYALAHVGIADSWTARGWYSVVPPKEAYPKTKAAASRALEVDDTLAEAHASLAMVHFEFDWNWRAAEASFTRAIDLNPGYATAHQWYGGYLSAMGRVEEAHREAERAKELDPLSGIVNTWAGLRFYYERENDSALEQYSSALEVAPNFVPLHWHLGWAYEYAEQHAAAIEQYQVAIRLSGDRPLYLAALARAYAGASQTEEAQERLGKLHTLSERQYVPAYEIATIYMSLGQFDLAFEWLERAYEERSPRLAYLNVEPRLDTVRSDPRFQDLRRRMNFLE